MTGFEFEPSGERGRVLGEGMRRDLLSSVEYLSTCASSAALGSLLRSAATRLSSAGALAPAAYGLYFQVAESMLREDEDSAMSAATLLSDVPSLQPGVHLLGRGLPEALVLDRVLDQRLGPEARDFAPVQSADVDDFAPRLSSGMGLLQIGAPGLFDELQAILAQILVAKAPAAGNGEVFDGASHYQFWGLLLLNPSFHSSRLAMAEVLAHESGHSVLFGLTRHEPLVLNADDERYPSPLRTDERPMDGIFHATYVLARMAWTMETLADSGQLAGDESGEARQAAARDRELFASGMSVISRYAKLSATGRQIMDGAQAWVEATRGKRETMVA